MGCIYTLVLGLVLEAARQGLTQGEEEEFSWMDRVQTWESIMDKATEEEAWEEVPLTMDFLESSLCLTYDVPYLSLSLKQIYTFGDRINMMCKHFY